MEHKTQRASCWHDGNYVSKRGEKQKKGKKANRKHSHFASVDGDLGKWLRRCPSWYREKSSIRWPKSRERLLFISIHFCFSLPLMSKYMEINGWKKKPPIDNQGRAESRQDKTRTGESPSVANSSVRKIATGCPKSRKKSQNDAIA